MTTDVRGRAGRCLDPCCWLHPLGASDRQIRSAIAVVLLAIVGSSTVLDASTATSSAVPSATVNGATVIRSAVKIGAIVNAVPLYVPSITAAAPRP